MDHRNLGRYFQRRIVAARLPHQRFHDARHACATFLVSQRVPLKVVQEILGHSSIQLTADTYAHVLPELQREAMDSFDRVDRVLRPASAAV
ncbi:MAG: tyrosine-type recombinase/integrase [Dehalococcoidia bacterium]